MSLLFCQDREQTTPELIGIMKTEKDFLETEPIKKLLPKLAIPAVAAQLVSVLYNVVDRIYIGHIRDIGSMAISGVGVCSPIIIIVAAFATFVSFGCAPRASIAMGAGDEDKAEKIMGNGFTLLLLFSVLLTIALLLWNRKLLFLFGASDSTIDYALTYMTIYTFGTVFVQITIGMNAFITAQGFTVFSMLTIVLGAVLNIILDPILIFAADLGVAGAAVATVISQGVSCVWVLSFLLGKKTFFKLKPTALGFDSRILLPCMALGCSPFIMHASDGLLNICFNTSLLKYGGDLAVGSMTILASILQFMILPMQGIAQGSQPIIGYNYGAGNSERVKAATKLLILSSLAWGTAFWLIIMLFPHRFVGWFTSDPLLISCAVRALRIYFATAFLNALQTSCQMVFIAIGYARSSMIVAITRKFILLIPAIYIMPALFGKTTDMVFCAEPVADTIAITFTCILFRFRFTQVLAALEQGKKE